MAIKISGSTIIDDSRNIVNAGIITASSFNSSAGAGLTIVDGGVLFSGVVTSTSFSGSLAASNLTGTITASAITLADESSDTTCFPVFATAATGDLAPKTGDNLTFNSSSGALTATSFVGDVTGDVTGTATTATNLANAANITTGTINVARLGSGASGTKFLRGDNTWQTVSGGGGDVIDDTTPQLGGNLDINSKYITGTGGVNVTGIITATTFSGNLPTTDLTGTITNAQLAGSIANAKLVNDSVSFGGVSVDLGASDATPAFDLTDATAYPYTSLTGITTEIVGDTTPQLGGNLDINSKYITGTGGVNVTGVVTATSFTGNGSNLTGIVTSIVAGSNVTISGSTGQVTINSSGGGGSSGPDPVIMGMIF